MAGAWRTGTYENVFAQLGYSLHQITRRVQDTFDGIFLGPQDQRLYHPAGEDMGYIVDTGNHDVRTEGMSYGMMAAVQMDRRDVFDRLWNWAKTHMYIEHGPNKGYFAWSVHPSGRRNSWGPAPDGEEYFAMALLFAAGRWGDGEGIYHYTRQARQLLHTCVHKGEDGIGSPIFDPVTRLIRFAPGMAFSNPSYHLPHFYELFALWGNPQDAAFFHEAAQNSRRYLQKACHPVTGLAAEYADDQGRPHPFKNHHHFYSDAYRVAANIGLDWAWFAADPWQRDCADNIQRFFCETAKGRETLVYEIDGTPVTDPDLLVREADGTPAGVLHPVGLLATNAMASLAARGPYRLQLAQQLWDTPLRTGPRRYYDNLLYLFAMLALSGNYRIYPHPEKPAETAPPVPASPIKPKGCDPIV